MSDLSPQHKELKTLDTWDWDIFNEHLNVTLLGAGQETECIYLTTQKVGDPDLETLYHKEDGSASFSCKGQDINLLGFVDCMVSVVTTELCHSSREAAIDCMWTNVPIKLYLQTLAEGLIQPLSPSVWIPYIEYASR